MKKILTGAALAALFLFSVAPVQAGEHSNAPSTRPNQCSPGNVRSSRRALEAAWASAKEV